MHHRVPTNALRIGSVRRMSEHVDVVVVGAGISGIGAAYHLQTLCPDRTFTILEMRDDIGGTWDLFRYPGVRSDSDMHTLGFSFKPWVDDRSIADGPSIMRYLRETVAEFGIDRHIRFGHRVVAAAWSSDTARWTLTVHRADGGRAEITCSYLYMCSGYYSYSAGYPAEIPGIETFGGQVVHPQFWPDDLDYRGKRVIVIGSGATAMTLVPAMARDVAHITMLQRTPTYVVAAPDRDAVANTLRKVLPSRLAYRITRRKNLAFQQYVYGKTRTQPAKVRAKLLKLTRNEIGPELTEQHFTPSYNPWDQRLCLIPNGDLYRAINSGKASVVTDHIDTVTETGIRVRSGDELPADIIITATGLQLVTVGEIDMTVDGVAVDFSETWTYKGVAYSDVPNMASSFGYVNASWTLRSDMIARWVCRILNHMRATGTDQCTPRLRETDRDMPRRPWIDDFSAGYITRMMPLLPKQGDRAPWLNPQRFGPDRDALQNAPVDDGVMRFTRVRVRVPA
jgi:monooxygenase